MKYVRRLLLGVAVSSASFSVAAADLWEPGVSGQINFDQSWEMTGESSSKMDGEQRGIAFRYASAHDIPFSVGISYQQGDMDHSGDPLFDDVSADTTHINIDALIGKVFSWHQSEMVLYSGVGFRQVEQDFDVSTEVSGSDLIIGNREQMNVYLPFGIYYGTSRGLDRLDAYAFAEYREVLAGEVTLKGAGSSTHSAGSGNGYRLEAGLQLPGAETMNAFAGLYYETLTIDSASESLLNSNGIVTVRSEPETDTSSLGLVVGLHF